MIQLICADSMKILPAILEHSKPNFDMIFLDPPFFEWEIEYGHKPDHNRLSVHTLELLKPNGIVWLCGTQPQLIQDWRYWSRFFRVVFEMIQYKHSGTPPISKWQPIRVHENIWCLVRKRARISDSNLDIRKLSKKGKKVYKKQEDSQPMRIRYGKTWVEWRTNVIYLKSVVEVAQIKKGSKEYEGHPTQKPLKLMELIVRISTKEGDRILDPFAGSGSTLVTAREFGRSCLGIEMSREYCRLIRRRLKRVKEIAKLSSYL